MGRLRVCVAHIEIPGDFSIAAVSHIMIVVCLGQAELVAACLVGHKVKAVLGGGLRLVDLRMQ